MFFFNFGPLKSRIPIGERSHDNNGPGFDGPSFYRGQIDFLKKMFIRTAFLIDKMDRPEVNIFINNYLFRI